jgi:hypothetical protein
MRLQEHRPIFILVLVNNESMLIPMQDTLPFQERIRSGVSKEAFVTIDTEMPSKDA